MACEIVARRGTQQPSRGGAVAGFRLIAVAAALWLVWVLGLLPDGGFLVGLTLVGWFQLLNTDHNAGLR